LQGIAPLFAGLTPALAGSTLQFALLMGLYDPIRDRARAAAPPSLPRGVPDMAAGALAGAAACVATNPVWVLKTRLQTAPVAMQPEGVMSVATSIVRHEGGRALFRGVAPSMLLVSFNVLQLPLYKELRQRGFGTFPAVFASVSAASAATYPLQVIRTRFQAERAVDGRREYQSFGAVVKHVVRQADCIIA
jgi:hypothetical protein